MHYPIQLRFKLLALGQRVTATDAGGRVLMFVKQKKFKLREQIEVYGDAQRSNLLFRIAADRVIDWSASYHFTDAAGNDWGSVRRRGMKSLWSAHYEVLQGDRVVMSLQEENPIKKLLEGLLGQIPVLGYVAVLLLNPTYLVQRDDGTPLLRLTKRAAVFEGKFTLEKLGEISDEDQQRALLALIMLVLLERGRG